MKALLALEDGRTFPCKSFTGQGEASGEVVFNTSKPPDLSVVEMIQERSQSADVVFFGLAPPEKDSIEKYIERMESLSRNHPVVFFVKNSSEFGGSLL